MSRRVQYIDAAGLRGDGRRPKEARVPSIALGAIPDTDGSCIFTTGSTIVSAAVYGPRAVANRMEARSDEAIFSCKVAFAATAAERRRQARRNNRITDDISGTISQALESSLLLATYPNASVTVAIEVIQADGNELAACITAASVALADAGVAMRDLVVGCTAGIIDGATTVTDLTANEVRSGCPVLHLAVMSQEPTAIVAFSLDARVADTGVDDMYAAATNGCIAVAAVARAALKAEVEQRVAQRGTAGFVQAVRA